MLALIAGQGNLPTALLSRLEDRPIVASLEGFYPDGVQPDMLFRLERLGTFIAGLVRDGVTRVCFAGGISRPYIEPEKIDEKTLPLIPRIAAALGSGDDAALRVILGMFEEAGLKIVAASEIAPDLLPPPGIHTVRTPTESNRVDASRAEKIAAGMGELDIGQSCAVHKGQALAIETLSGTDFMLTSLKHAEFSPGGVFYKAKKPSQDVRVDLPVVGESTVKKVKEARLSGLVIQAGGVMVLDMPAVVALADELDLFLWVRAA